MDHNPFASAAAIKTADNKIVTPGVGGMANVLGKGVVKRFETQKKQILYSDKSESSFDEDMMGDTPSNYNALNGRFEGKSAGLKSMLDRANVPVGIDFQNNLSQAIRGRGFSQGPSAPVDRSMKVATKSNEQSERRFVSNLRQGRANGASVVQRGANQIVGEENSAEEMSEQRRRN